MIRKAQLVGGLLLIVLGSLALECGFSAAQSPVQGLAILEQFAIDRDQLLTLPVTIEGRVYSFVLDTGCAQTALDSGTFNLGKPLGFKRLRTASGAIITAPQFPGPPMSLGNIHWPGSPVMSHDLNMLRMVSGQEIHGILGMNHLKDFVCRLDFDAGKVLFLKSPGPNPGQPLRLSIDEMGPHVQTRIAGLGSVTFLVDTGYGGRGSGDLEGDLMKQLFTKKQAIKANECLGTDASGTISSSMARLDSFALGDMSHRQLVFGEGALNLLGLTYLSRYTVTFDFPNKVMYLQKGGTYGDPDLLDLSGLHFLRHEGKTVIAQVDRGSPAETVGIQPGDMIVALGGRAADQTSLFLLRRLLCDEGQRISLTIRRGERDYETALVLKAWW